MEIKKGSGQPEVLPTILLGEYAQKIYDDPAQAWEHIDELHGRVRQHFADTGMAKTRPEMAEYMTIRCLWDTAGAVMFHAMEVEQTAELLDDLASGRPLASPELTEATTFDDKFFARYEGTLLATLRAASDRSTGVAERLLARVVQDDDPYRPVWDVFSALHPAFSDVEQVYKKAAYDIDWRRNDNPRDAVLKLAVDTNETALSILSPLIEGWHLANIVARSKQIGWAASIGGYFLVKHFPRPGHEINPNTCPYVDSPPEWSESDSVSRLPSLRKGPWRTPGHCPANPALFPPTAEGKTVTRDILQFVHQGDDRLALPDVAMSAAEMRLISVAYTLDEVLRRQA